MNRISTLFLTLIGIGAAMLIGTGAVQGASRSSASYEIGADVRDSGGRRAGSSDFSLDHSLGQAVCGGPFTSADYENRAGGIAQLAALARNYVELTVRPDASGGYEFHPGDVVILEWETHEDEYGFEDVPCNVYLAAALDPPGEDTEVTVAEIAASGALYLFDSRRSPSRYDPSRLRPTYSAVFFPVQAPPLGSSGTISFTVPSGAAGRWAFAAAFVRTDTGQFPSSPPVEVSGGFTIVE